MTSSNFGRSDNEEMLTFADELADYMWSKHFAPKLTNNVRFYRAEVTEAASDGKIGIIRPFETDTTYLPYVTSAAGLAVGEQCVVLILGGGSNAIILGDGTLTNL